jgi:hypothetical protein
MSCRPLVIPESVPPEVAFVVREALQLRFNDVHAMLRLPLHREGMVSVGCNFAIVDVLLSAIAGVSTILYPREPGSGGDGGLFTTCVSNFWPQDEPTPRIDRCELGAELWKKARNPMAHCLGMALEKNRRSGNRMPADWGHSVKIVRDRGSWSPGELAVIEASDGWPSVLTRPTGQWAEGFLKLSCEALYRGVRKMTEAVLREREHMERAAARLRQLAPSMDNVAVSNVPPTVQQTIGALRGTDVLRANDAEGSNGPRSQ